MASKWWFVLLVIALPLPLVYLVNHVPLVGATFGAFAVAVWAFAMWRAVRQGLREQRHEKDLRRR